DLFCQSQVELEEPWRKETVASEAAVASGRWRHKRHGKRGAVVGQADIRHSKLRARNVRGSCAARHERWARFRSAEIQSRIRAVVDRMRPCVAGEEHESFGEALLYIDRERVIPRARIGELRVHAVERNGNSKTGWISREVRERNLRAEATGGRGERGVGTGRS